jgi:NADPH:quinone reductase-like Zn-dependent oxidoreductase
VVEAYGGPDVLQVVDGEIPRPRPGEVAVRVLAAGVSYTDMLIRAGSYFECPKPPFTPGYELVGVVEDVGTGCATLRPGDRVAAITVHGAYAERAVVPEVHAVPVPADMDPAQQVALVLTYVTARQLLERFGKAARGESVLVHGAAGQVGTAVLELGVPAGLTVYGTAAGEGCERVARLGGLPIDHTREDFLARVLGMTGDGVDVVLDGMGGGLSLRSYRALRSGGRLVIYGHHATLSNGRRSRRGWAAWYAATACVAVAGFLSPRRRVMGYRIAKVRDRHPDWFRDDLLHLVGLLRRGAIRPVVADRMPLAEARRAHERLQAGGVSGKLVLVP